MRTYRRAVAAVAGPGVRAARTVYSHTTPDVLRVAALVEISAAAAALARTIVKLRRLDPDLIAPHVADPTDLRAVLGRGRWLPTMTRHVPDPTSDPVPVGAVLPVVVATLRHRGTGRLANAGQLSLMDNGTGGGGEPGCR